MKKKQSYPHNPNYTMPVPSPKEDDVPSTGQS